MQRKPTSPSPDLVKFCSSLNRDKKEREERKRGERIFFGGY
jgi:hypothetical protein